VSSATEAAVRAVLRDLSAVPGRPADDVGFELRDAGELILSFVVGGVGIRFPIDCALAVDWRLIAYEFAGQLQDTVAEDTTEPRPECPRRRHMLVPDSVGGVPMWTCSRSGWSVGFGAYWAAVRG
jgi:hypothetical protein